MIQFTFGQISSLGDETFSAKENKTLNKYKVHKPNHLENISPGHYSKADWKEIIDSTWGEGLPTAENLAIFDLAWNYLDQGYGAFMNMYVNLDSLRNVYRPEILAGVSRGRFAAIMNHLAYALKDAHTIIDDLPVNAFTDIQPGIPIFVTGACVDISRFGAGLTPLPDSTLLVYKTLPDHTLGLKVGDIVLGYDGVPWKNLYKQLLDAELPLRNSQVGSNDESAIHIALQSAGLNWHLFDTIDIIKYNTGDTVHLPTALLQNQSGDIWGNEQLAVNGVDFPDVYNWDFVSWGMVEGTTIGYIYVWSWFSDTDVSDQFYEAVFYLMNRYETSGLIIDFRVNYGGTMETAHQAYSLLFNETIENVAFDTRGDPNDHLDMVPSTTHLSNRFIINGDPNTFYDKPIAVLTGPNAFSNGDWESVRMQFHPMVRTFGKSTNGAFTISDMPDLGNPDFMFSRGIGSGYLIEDHQYLVHRSANIDEKIWLKQEDVVKGDDTVVKRAIEWINNTSTGDKTSNIIKDINFSIENYPNPFNYKTKIKYTIPEAGKVSLRIYNILGKEVANIINNEFCNKGEYIKTIDNQNIHLEPGVYFISLCGNTFQKTHKMIINSH
ncbi:S41 family peptidase [Bacteroidota bacterium]